MTQPGARRSARAAVAAVLVLPLGLLVAACGDGQAGIKVETGAQRAEYDYVIPPGAVQAVKDGKSLDIVPQHLKVKVGERIRIRNRDSLGASVGVFYVGAGETVSMRFTRKGELSGSCSIHPSGKFTITVT